MRPLPRLLLFAFLLLVTLSASAATRRVYFIGNSVTDCIQYTGLEALAQSRGHNLPWGRHIVPGAPLDLLWNDTQSTFYQPPYGRHQTALTGYPWDFINLQPFDRGLASDRASVQSFVNEAGAQSPGATVLVYARWPRNEEDFDTRWLRTYANQTYGPELESKSFFEQLTQAVRSDYPSRNVFMVPVGHVLYELNQQIKAGQVPGLTSIYNLYADTIHLDNRGKYLVALTFFTTLFREDPRGLPVPAEYGTIDPALVSIFQNTVLNVVAAHPLSGVVLNLPLQVGTSALPPAIQGTSYRATLSAVFGSAPFNWSLVGGSLPAGISLAANGTLAGTPMALGSSTFTVRVTDSAGATARATFTLSVEQDTVPSITTTSLPSGALGTPYQRVFPGFAATSGNGALTWTLAAGALPVGVSLAANGVLTGAPQATGTFSFTVKVTDSDATPDSDQRAFSLVIGVAQSATLTARKINADVHVDGTLDEPFWAVNKPISVATGGTLGGLNEGAFYDAVWDSSFLYVAVKVTDSELRRGASPLTGDSVHLFVDSLHDGQVVFNAGHRHFAVCPFGRGLEPNGRDSGIIYAARRVPGGYTVEIAMPWTNLGIVPADNLSIGFDVAVADALNGDAIDGQLALGGTQIGAPSPAQFRDLLCLPTVDAKGARAGLLAGEGFDYAAGSLNSKNTGSGWYNNTGWEVQNGDTTQPGYQVAASRSLTYPGLATSPGYATGGCGYNSSGRRFDTTPTGAFASVLNGDKIGKSGSEVWVAWLVRRESAALSEVALHQSTIGWNGSSTMNWYGVANVAVKNVNEKWALTANAVTVDTGVPATVGQTFLMVLRLNYGATNTAALFVNPTPGILPLTPTKQITNAGDLQFRSLAWYPGDLAGQGALDEIRVGTTYAAVTPTVETPAMVLSQIGNQTAPSGTSLNVAADVVGSNLQVSWQKATQTVAGQSGALLSFAPITNSDSGSYQFAVQNRLGAVTSSSFQTTVTGRTRAEWRQAKFSTTQDAGAAADTAAPAGDGMANVLKFAMGLEPLTRALPPPLVWANDNAGAAYPALQLRHDTAANDVALIIEGSSDFSTWETLATYQGTAAAQIAYGIQVSRDPMAGEPGVERIVVRANRSGPRYFLRARSEVRTVLP